MRIAIIGGGAAGFFAAISCKEHHPQAEVSLFEKSKKVLSKVKVSGGGRCNVTNVSSSIKELVKAYPRGQKLMKRALRKFNTTDTHAWFEQRGVKLKAEPDGRMFPVTDDSQTVIDCLFAEVNRLGIEVNMGAAVQALHPVEAGLKLIFKEQQLQYDKVIVATGGSPKRTGLQWLEDLGHEIADPVPSLFTFNMPGNPVRELMGVVAKEAAMSIQGTSLKSEGPLLITHWGMSGPAVLKLSAFGARALSEMNYHFKTQVNWVNQQNQDLVTQELRAGLQENPKKKISNLRIFGIQERLWLYFLEKAEIAADKICAELPKKSINRLVHLLCNDEYEVRGKTTFKEEFVTCGGVAISSVNVETMASKACEHLYFCGEVLDVDGITGGYNFQAAWATGFIAGQLA